jgi:microcystin degradation protein MlrC
MPRLSLGRGDRPLRIGYGRIFHEANAFSPLQTQRRDFENFHLLEGAALERATSLRGQELASVVPHAELTGFRQAMRVAGGVEAVPLLSALAVPSGPVERADFEQLVDDLIGKISSAGELDGVYLALHGSMQVAELDEAPEAVILRRVRAALRPGARIAVSYDLHGNLSAGLVEPVDVLVAYRSNPHWDLVPTGFRAGNRLVRVLRGELDPVHAWRKLPMIFGGGTTIDFLAPMRGVFRAMRRMERDPRVISASLFMVHPFTTAVPLGWSVHVSTSGDPALAERLADELADLAWAERHVAMPDMRTVDEALDEVARGHWRRLGPVTFVDADDVVGAGAPGGNTRIVAALARNDRGLRAFVPVHDPVLVDELWNAPLGQRRSVVLRGTPGYRTPAVPLDVVVAARATTELGRLVRLDSGSFHVVISERPPMPIHPRFWSEVGLSSRKADVIVQKNFFHYRIFYAAISFRHIGVISSGATSFAEVRARPYPISMHPVVEVPDWRRDEPALRAMTSASRA